MGKHKKWEIYIGLYLTVSISTEKTNRHYFKIQSPAIAHRPQHHRMVKENCQQN